MCTRPRASENKLLKLWPLLMAKYLRRTLVCSLSLSLVRRNFIGSAVKRGTGLVRYAAVR